MDNNEQKKQEMIDTIYNGVKSMEYFFVPVAQMPNISPQDYQEEQTRIIFEMLMMPDGSRWFAVFAETISPIGLMAVIFGSQPKDKGSNPLSGAYGDYSSGCRDRPFKSVKRVQLPYRR